MNKKVWIAGALALMLAAMLGGYYLFSLNQQRAQAAAAADTPLQTAIARRGELTLVASGAGQLIPAAEWGVGFDQGGTLIEINVSVGDSVAAGDVLGRLQTAASAEDIALAVAQAELAVIEAQQALDELYANAGSARASALSAIAAYAQEARDAQYQFENYNLPTYLQDLGPVEALDQMQAELAEASAAFEPYRYFSADNAVRKELLVDLNTAQSRYDAAVKRLDYEYAVQAATANLEKARQEYAAVENGPAADELALAEARLANAQAALALAQQEQPVIELISPAAGTVMEITAGAGEIIGSGVLMTLADLAHPLLEVYLDETDLNHVAVGYPVTVVFDALPEQTFSGHVTAVSPALETVGNVQAVRVEALLDDAELAQTLPVGLNASVDVLAGQALDAVLIPVEALRELGPDEYAVFVLEDGEPKLRVVTVGLMDLISVEITSGLAPGEVVTTGIVQTQ